LKDQGIDEIKMDIMEVGWGLEWIQLAQDRGSWRAVVYAGMNIGFWRHGVS
jgi:hypothetical protein